MTTALAEVTRALREALGDDRSETASRARPPRRRPQLPHAAAARPRRLPDLGGRGRARAGGRRRTGGRGDAVRGGHSLEGHVIPVHGGLSLDLSRLDRIVEISPANLTATVQAGVTRTSAAARRRPARPLLPGRPRRRRDARGMAATNAAGRRRSATGRCARTCSRSRPCSRAGGDPHRQPRREDSAGYDLTGLLVGSEGTLAVITEVTVRLHAIPEHVVALRISFPDVESACRTAAARRRRRRGLPHRAARRVVHGGRQRLLRDGVPEGPTLLVEAAGSAELVDADLELVQAIAARRGDRRRPRARPRRASAPVAGAARRGARAAARFPGTKERTTDVCVPLTELAGAVRFARSEIERLGLEAGILGHAGDGNLHVAMQLAARGQRGVGGARAQHRRRRPRARRGRAPASTASASARSARSSGSTATWSR